VTDALFPVRDVVAYALLAGVLAGAGLAAVMPWSRRHARFLITGVATFAGFVAWNLTLNVTRARGFNTDAPVIGLSWADAGSGVLAFLVAVIALTALNRSEPAHRVVGGAALAGLIALVVDIFVL